MAAPASAAEPTDANRHGHPTTRLAAGLAAPSFARLLPARTTQVVRTIRTNRWCERRWCTVTQLWDRDGSGEWNKARAFRSTIGPNGFGKRREGDHRSPSGVYRIRVTFSTGTRPPGAMPWKQRLRTSNVTNQAGRLYNTWIEEPWRTNGARASMRWGFIVNYNRPRLEPGVRPETHCRQGIRNLLPHIAEPKLAVGSDRRMYSARQAQTDAVGSALARSAGQASRRPGTLKPPDVSCSDPAPRPRSPGGTSGRHRSSTPACAVGTSPWTATTSADKISPPDGPAAVAPTSTPRSASSIELDQALVAALVDPAPRRRRQVGEPDPDVDAPVACLLLGQADRSDLGIGEGHPRDRPIVRRGTVTARARISSRSRPGTSTCG